MRSVAVALVAVLLVVAHLPSGLAFPSTAPALLWSPYQDGMVQLVMVWYGNTLAIPIFRYGTVSRRIKEAVSYETLSAKDLAKSVMSKGGWSNLLCSGKETQQSLDLVLIFVGRELQSLDISGNKHADPSMVELLRGSYTKSKFSLAFPYVAASEEKEAMEISLVSGFSESCGQDSEFSDVAFLDSCSVEGNNFEKLADSQSVHDYMVTKIEKGPKGQANLIVFCHKGLHSLRDVDQPRSESQVFSELISTVERSGAKYTVLYVSDPLSSSIWYPSSRELERFLAESSSGNGPLNSTVGCDGVCQIKSSLLEGLLVVIDYVSIVSVLAFVSLIGVRGNEFNGNQETKGEAIVLLIILISGLCCMMGIDTPTRFETPQDS
ncbi:hypothetical protein LguiB_001815 [Lonicera macranthoides]